MTPEAESAKEKLVRALGPKFIADCQKDVDKMKKMPQYKQYIAQRKMELLMGENGKFLDTLLKAGIIQ